MQPEAEKHVIPVDGIQHHFHIRFDGDTVLVVHETLRIGDSLFRRPH